MGLCAIIGIVGGRILSMPVVVVAIAIAIAVVV
jgi:hypothetical protein